MTCVKFLILGGTQQARLLADQLYEKGYKGIYSLAGITDHPRLSKMTTRQGGFGGLEGFVNFLQEEAITHIIDATHNFATEMRKRAWAVSQAKGVPMMRLHPAPWIAQDGDQWISVPHLDDAIDTINESTKRHLFSALGAKEWQKLQTLRPDLYVTARMVSSPKGSVSDHWQIILAKGPFKQADEETILKTEQAGLTIDLIVMRNAGGQKRDAKLDAARHLGLSIVMIEQPDVPQDLPVFETIEALILDLPPAR